MNLASNSFHHQKSPKIGTTGGLKQMKIGGAPGSHGNSMQYGQANGKNMRIMLVGNNGNKSSQNAYK